MHFVVIGSSILCGTTDIGLYATYVPIIVFLPNQLILSSFVDPSAEITHRFGCSPSVHNQDVWPAYLCIILGETGKQFPTQSHLDSYPSTTGIVGLTLFKKWLDPVRKCDSIVLRAVFDRSID